jgi:hypothetical protein
VGVLARLEGGIDVLCMELELDCGEVTAVDAALRLLIAYCKISGRSCSDPVPAFDL